MWDVRLHPEVEAWFLDLCRVDPASADLVGEAIDLLAEHGPALGVHWWTGSRAARSIT
ncbi:hypothetical protein ACN265_27325 [Micromonospora sp. WMMD730]|uniref:hypothetical protein n=1 Tax=Micromonospora sp. WMMD730 TaxID=3404128 RepID=UPI003B93FF7A